MPEHYEQLPPEREVAYLDNAKKAINEASEIAMAGLGVAIADQTEAYLRTYDTMRADLIKSLEEPRIEDGIVAGAEQFLATHPSVAYGLKAPQGSAEAKALKYPQTQREKRQTLREINNLLACGLDDEICALTITPTSPQRVNKDGILEHQTESGRWVEETAVQYARGRWGNNAAALKAARQYVLTKIDPDKPVS